jgi:coenzyme PQQ precursor peptide PqqA
MERLALDPSLLFHSLQAAHQELLQACSGGSSRNKAENRTWIAWTRRLPGHLVEHAHKEAYMAWKTPKIVEIAVGLESNSYASAEIK